MPRYLKTKYPCRECGEPAEVMHTSHAKLAICQPCSKRRGRLMSIDYADREVVRLGIEGNNLDRPEPERLGKWLRAVAAELVAAAKCVEAVPDVQPGETLRMWRGTRKRMEWADATIEKLLPLLEAAREEIVDDLHIDVIDGEGVAVESPETGAPVLRLVHRDDG